MLIGIVGKANVGKSSFFKAATLAEAEIAGRPFVTIKPNEGVGFVRTECPEKFYNVKCNPQKGFCIDGQRFVPVKLLDVAGLVPGAHEGKGLGLQFLDDLRQADVLIHIVDAAGATNEMGEPTKPGSHDPCDDVRFLENELDHWFFQILKDGWHKFARQTTMGGMPADKSLADQVSGLKVDLPMVKKTLMKLKLDNKKLDTWTDEELMKFSRELRKLSKPMIIAANKTDLPQTKENIKRLKKEFPDDLVVPCSAAGELILREAARDGIIKYIPGDSHFEILKPEKVDDRLKKGFALVNQILKEYGNTGVQNCLNAAVFEHLKYIVVFPGGVSKLADARGNVLPDAFLLPPGSTAYNFAEKIHTDLAKGFVAAIDVKKKQKIGRDHELKSGDIVEIMFKK